MTRTDIELLTYEELEATFDDYFKFNFYQKPNSITGYQNKMMRQKEFNDYLEFKRNKKELIKEQKKIVEELKPFFKSHPRFAKQFTKNTTTYKHIKDFYYNVYLNLSENEKKFENN